MRKTVGEEAGGGGGEGGAGEQGAEGVGGGGGGGGGAGGGGGGGGGGGLEVELSPRAVEDEGGAVVGAGGVLGGGESAEPLAGALARLTDLSDPFAPAALPNTTVSKLVVVGTTFAFALAGRG